MAEKKKRKYQKVTRKWILGAKLQEGALVRYVMGKYGKKRGFDKNGNIRMRVLKELAGSERVLPITRKRARLAITLRKF